jgi:hypothetical protein
MYNVSVQYSSQQQTPTEDNNNLYMVIVGENGQTKKLPLSMKNEIEFTATDVGKVS